MGKEFEKEYIYTHIYKKIKLPQTMFWFIRKRKDLKIRITLSQREREQMMKIYAHTHRFLLIIKGMQIKTYITPFSHHRLPKIKNLDVNNIDNDVRNHSDHGLALVRTYTEIKLNLATSTKMCMRVTRH